MKDLLIVLFFFMMLLGCTEEVIHNDPKTGWDEYGLKGEVKSLKTMYANINEEGLVKQIPDEQDWFLGSDVSFDRKGNILGENLYYSQSKREIFSSIIYKYNDKDQLIEEEYYEKEKLDYLLSYSYNSKGYLIGVRSISDNQCFSRETYSYDKNNNLIGEIKETYGELGGGYTKTEITYKYNKQGNCIEYFSEEDNGSYFKYQGWRLKYDEHGTLIKKYIYDRAADDFVLLHTYHYDEKNRKTETNVYSDDQISFRKVYRYDDRDSVIEIKNYEMNDSLVCMERYVYDETGNNIEYEKCNEAFIYEYDQMKNVIYSVILDNGIPIYFKKRIIEYY